MSGPARIAVILAAGKGTRMRSEAPKVLHRVAGRPMLAWVIDAVRQAGCERTLVVVGHQAERVRTAFDEPDLTWVLQEEQRGTGHALAQVASEVDSEALLLVASGDVPLLSAGTLERLADSAAAGWGSMAVARLDEPGSLGRVLATDARLERIVEAADATAEELAIDRVNAGLYALPAPAIFPLLDALAPANQQGELYLTDALNQAAAAGQRVALVELDDPAEAMGINDRLDLARVHRVVLERKLEALARAGVTVLDPSSTTVEAQVEVGADTVLHPGVALLGGTRVGSGCELHQGAWLADTVLGDEVTVAPYSVLDGAEVGSGCRVGPFTRLRTGARLEDGSRAGTFVEIKNSTLGEGAKANHLTYLGDATIGERANIGAGTVTCNYDGRAKHPTTIGDEAFIGSDTMLVAPVEIGERATTAAGSVITKDVPPGALATGRSRQRNLEGWERRRRKREKE